MRAYIDFLNDRHLRQLSLDLEQAEDFWIQRVRDFFEGKPFILKLDPSWSVRTAVRHLLSQAQARQKSGSGTMFVGTMMQHLVGAKLTVCTRGELALEHHSVNTSDQNPSRHGDFDLGDVAIHVTTSPSEALIRKCVENLGRGRRPLIITSTKGVATAEGLLDNAGAFDRVDVVEFEQFIATNVFELGNFATAGRNEAMLKIIDAYNEIVDEHESDPSLRIDHAKAK